MRQFSEQEKQLIYSIYRSKDSNQYILTNVFAKWLYGDNAIGYDVENGCLIFDGEQQKDAEEMLDIQKGIIQTALLIKYLEDEGYIYLIKDSSVVANPPYIGKNISQNHMPLRVPVPNDIADIINRSFYRVYVSYALSQLVENGFKTYEELQLLASKDQLEKSSQQLAISEAQLEEARKQTQEAQKQTDAAQAQLVEAKMQTKAAQQQTKEAEKQTKEAQQQTAEAIEQTKQVNEQTKKVNEQTKKVNEQTKNSLTQTKLAWGAFIGSALTFVASIVLPLCINKCSHQEEKHVEIINSINGVNTTIQRGSEQISTYIDSINTNEMQQVKQNDSIIQVLNKRENTQNRKK